MLRVARVVTCLMAAGRRTGCRGRVECLAHRRRAARQPGAQGRSLIGAGSFSLAAWPVMASS